MQTTLPLNIVLGTGNVGDMSMDKMARFDTPEQVEAFVAAFEQRGGHQIDTARGYSPHAPGSCEPRLAAVNAGRRFTIDTKVKSGEEGAHRKEGIESSISESLKALRVEQVNIMLLHSPDRSTPLEETCHAMDAAYRQGKFKQFGLSNYSPGEVQQICEICERDGLVKPTIYQGQFNPLVRGGERDLFPLLRQHAIAFYAFSPGAGGFFAGGHKNPTAGGRFDKSHMIGEFYSAMYDRPGVQEATDKAVDIIAKHGINGHAAALRWTVYHSLLAKKHGDAVIIGASSVPQLISNFDFLGQGPLPSEVVTVMENLWDEVAKSDVPYHV